MTVWKVDLIPEAKADFAKLDGHVRKQVLKQLVKLEKDPRYGEPLGDKAGIDLISNQARARMISLIKAGMSEGWREVMILPSTTTSESSYSTPAASSSLATPL